jgi:hypothetical protein
MLHALLRRPLTHEQPVVVVQGIPVAVVTHLPGSWLPNPSCQKKAETLVALSAASNVTGTGGGPKNPASPHWKTARSSGPQFAYAPLPAIARATTTPRRIAVNRIFM